MHPAGIAKGLVMCVQPSILGREPTEEEVEAAARAWMGWQFPNRSWDDAIENMKQRFRDGASLALRAAAAVSPRESVH